METLGSKIADRNAKLLEQDATIFFDLVKADLINYAESGDPVPSFTIPSLYYNSVWDKFNSWLYAEDLAIFYPRSLEFREEYEHVRYISKDMFENLRKIGGGTLNGVWVNVGSLVHSKLEPKAVTKKARRRFFDSWW